jgi:prolyl-tRNA editing enzyme YbaK/EbsC (Cys-tRNA(Pro) deacylase)
MPTQPFTNLELQRFIDAHQIEATILPMAEYTPTVPDAARALGVATEQIIKSLVFIINGDPLLVINNGTALVDTKPIATQLGVGRKRVKFATPEQALEISGYVVGSMPPFGHKQRLRTFIDPAVMELAVIYGGGGVVDAMMRLTSAELLRVTVGELVAVSQG